MTRTFAFAIAASLLTSDLAYAGEATLTSAVFKEVEVRDAGGRVSKSLEPVARVTPGDQVLYVLTYRNGDARPADNIVVTNPIASDLVYAGPADARPPMVSLDGQAFGDLPSLTTTRDGVSSPATPADVTAVRWRLTETIPAGGEVRLAFRARLK